MSAQPSRKKRRRNDSATMAALDLPDIPGVPMDCIPILVHAIRVTAKFYTKCRDCPYYFNNDETNSQDPTSTLSSSQQPPQSLVSALVERVNVATEQATTVNPQTQDLQERKERMCDATTRWLESVKRFTKTRRQDNTTNTEGTATSNNEASGNDTAKKEIISVPYASFLYLWDLQQTHDRVAVRRAALCLSGLLLERSKDCRFHLNQDDHLDTWLTSLLEHDRSSNKEEWMLWQLEADHVLHDLVQNGYTQLYPKIRVALQRLRQQLPHLQTAATAASGVAATTFSSMVDWRRIRDIALEHGEIECTRVERWMERAYTCLEILVPRIGMDASTASAVSKSTIRGGDHEEEAMGRDSVTGGDPKPVDLKEDRPSVQDDDDDEEDDIDWEDGGEDFDDGTANVAMLPDLEHFSAVERTLAAMESTGGLRGGEIEIDLRDNPQRKEEEELDAPLLDDRAKEERVAALAKFQKCVSILAKRHIPRLTVWLEGLTNADNLVVSKESSALVSMPSQMGARRKQLVHRLTELKQQVSSVLKSATKLNVQTGTEDEPAKANAVITDDNIAMSFRLSSTKSGNTQQRRENLLSAIHKQRKPKHRTARSNRIQIKFRSR